MGLCAVKKHFKGDKHQAMHKTMKSTNITNFVTTTASLESTSVTTASTSEPTSVTPTPTAGTSNKQSDMSPYVLKDSVTKAEVQWCLFAVTNNLSNRTAAAAVDLFKVMLPNNDIVKDMALGRDKVAYTVVHGIAPHFKKELQSEVTKSPVFVACFDESLNKVSQRGQMDVHIRYWVDDRVVTRYLTSEFLGHATAENLVLAINSALKDQDMSKLLQIGLDGPNVNLKALRLIKEGHSASHETAIIDIGSCSLHIVDGALRTGDKAGLNVMAFMKSCYWVFKDLPSRRADYMRFANDPTAQLPLKFCSTRWVENGAVAIRCIKMLPHLRAYVEGIMKNSKSQPISKSYETMKKMLSDPLLKAKLSFFISIVEELEPFLKEFQTDAPMLPFLYEELETLLARLMKRVVKPSVLEKHVSGSQKAKLNLDNDNILDAEKIAIGYGAKTAINDIKSSTSKELISEFMEQCRRFLLAFIKKIQHRAPLKHDFVRGCASLDPAIMSLPDNEHRTRLLDNALMYLVASKWIEGTEADRVKLQYEKVCSKPGSKEKCNAFNRRKGDRLDTFLSSLVDYSDAADDLKKYIELVLCLSHGQASVERGFSLNKDLLVENQKEESLIAQRHIKDRIHSLDHKSKS